MNPAHLDHEALADLAEGLLDDDHAASANAHLDDCADCQERSADLADVSRILAEIADIPVPPMPVELAARIDDAIRAESMATARVTSLEHRRGIRHLRTFSAAAAAVVAIGGAAFVGNSAFNDSSNEPTAQSGPVPADPPGSQDGGVASAPERSSAAASGSYKTTASGTNYRSDTLVRQVFALTAQLKGGLKPFQQSQAPDARVTDCVARVADGQTPALVDSAKYEGRSATVIAFVDKPGGMRILVTDPSTCSPLRPEVRSGG